METIGIYVLVGINLVALMLFGLDKRRARTGGWRISEKALFTAALVGGGFGAWCGMYLFHHKTRHWYFVWLIPMIAVAEYALLAGLMLR